jgi:hypothetical protein
MHRIQVQLTAAQEKALREMARLRGESISALIREGIDHLIEPHKREHEAKVKRALEALDAIKGLRDPHGATDVSVNHDKYLADAIYEDIQDNYKSFNRRKK